MSHETDRQRMLHLCRKTIEHKGLAACADCYPFCVLTQEQQAVRAAMLLKALGALPPAGG